MTLIQELSILFNMAVFLSWGPISEAGFLDLESAQLGCETGNPAGSLGNE
jgi:hypothetical protein